MTGFDADLHRLATQLATMVATPGVTTAADDTDLINRARRTLRNCCRKMLIDLAPPPADDAGRRPRVADLALNPVGVLHILLQHEPTPLTLSPDARTAAHIIEKANDHWKRLADAAEIVIYEWTVADPASRPIGDRAWTRIADVAALAQAGATLDRELVEADTASSKVLSECPEIELAAEHTRRYATSGPLPQPQPLRPEPQRLRPTLVRQLGDVPAGLNHLAILVTTAGHLRPDMIGALVAAHARTLDTFANALTVTSPPAHRAGRRRFAWALRSHGESLANAEPDLNRPRRPAARRSNARDPHRCPLTRRQARPSERRQPSEGAACRTASGARRHPRCRSRGRFPPAIRTVVHARRRTTAPVDECQQRSSDKRCT